MAEDPSSPDGYAAAGRGQIREMLSIVSLLNTNNFIK
jgi:hypothetical protein